MRVEHTYFTCLCSNSLGVCYHYAILNRTNVNNSDKTDFSQQNKQIKLFKFPATEKISFILDRDVYGTFFTYLIRLRQPKYIQSVSVPLVDNILQLFALLGFSFSIVCHFLSFKLIKKIYILDGFNPK